MNNPAHADVNPSAADVYCVSHGDSDLGFTSHVIADRDDVSRCISSCDNADQGSTRTGNNVRYRSEGNVGDVMPMCIFVICIAFVMITFSDCVRVIGIKTTVSQISRQYILRMETYGYLTTEDRVAMVDALSEAGLKGISLGDTDTAEVGYGNEIVLEIMGHTEDGYEIREFRTSTAKY